ncbi:MAG TPA: DinB family protein [Gammaproteobacteria bacterium]|nr:DinB family protein [Gammaproteobacteria bacterium]
MRLHEQEERMMRSNAVWPVVAAALMHAAPLGAQVQKLEEYHVADVENLRSKFVALAEAFPEERYDWRPMEGTRSVRDVLVLVAAEGNVFPANWGLPAAAGAAQGYQAESARVGAAATTKALLLAQLGRSFDHLSRSLAGMSDAARAADGRTFGREMTVEAGITLALSDLHEHLGQLIAYARMNGIVPPWSR